jgi:hypothetical protein
MNTRSMNSFFYAAFAAATLLCNPHDARALELSVQVLPISQVPPFTSRVRLGHIVNAKTWMFSVAAGGTLHVSCLSPYTGTIDAQNATAQTGMSPNKLSVEVPPGWLPAERELPGFNDVPGGTSLSCTYRWTAAGKEAIFSLGAGGTTMPIGGDATTKQDQVVFEMYKPGDSGSDDNNGCIH